MDIAVVGEPVWPVTTFPVPLMADRPEQSSERFAVIDPMTAPPANPLDVTVTINGVPYECRGSSDLTEDGPGRTAIRPCGAPMRPWRPGSEANGPRLFAEGKYISPRLSPGASGMHELSLADRILDLVAPKVGAPGRLSRVNVTVGPLSGVCADSLEFGFDVLARQRGFANARLVVHATEALVRCGGCAAQYGCASFMDPCPSCGSLEREVLSGTEFTVDSIEVDD